MNVRSLSDRNTLRMAMNVLGVLIIVAVVVPFIVYAVPGVVGADHGLVVLSGSMEPKMSPGDAVIVREVPPSEIETGDVITFQREGSDTPTTHRVIEIQQTEEGTAYVTKGDANEDPDRGTVAHSRVVGEVIFVIPLLGHVVQFANTQVGFLALVLTPMVLFVLSELWELAKSVREPDTPAATTATDEPSVTSVSSTAAGADVRTDVTGDTDEESGGFTLTRSSLQLILLLLVLYAPYSAYVAYTIREAWAITAATGTVIALLFCLVIYLASRGAGSDSKPTVARSTDGIVRHGELPARIGERTTVPLDSIESLVQMALDRDNWVIYDEDEDTYYVARDDALYLHRTSPETDGGVTVEATGTEDDRASTDEATTGGGGS
jgi:signal peptidase I